MIPPPAPPGVGRTHLGALLGLFVQGLFVQGLSLRPVKEGLGLCRHHRQCNRVFCGRTSGRGRADRGTDPSGRLRSCTYSHGPGTYQSRQRQTISHTRHKEKSPPPSMYRRQKTRASAAKRFWRLSQVLETPPHCWAGSFQRQERSQQQVCRALPGLEMAAKPLFARLQEPTRLATWVFSAVQGLDRFGPKARHLLSTTRSAAKTHQPTTRRSLNPTDQAERRRLCPLRAVPSIPPGRLMPKPIPPRRGRFLWGNARPPRNSAKFPEGPRNSPKLPEAPQNSPKLSETPRFAAERTR